MDNLTIFFNLLIKSGLLRQEDQDLLRAKYSTAEELFEGLSARADIPKNKLTETYAQAIGVPYVEIKTVDPAASSLIEGDLSLRFGFLPYAVDEQNKILHVGVLEPSKFKFLNQNAIKSLEAKLGYKIEIALSSRETAERALQKDQSQIPFIDLGRFDIGDELLRKIPYELAEKYKAIIFRRADDGALDLATAEPDNPDLNKMVDFVHKQSDVKINVYRAEGWQIDKLLQRYRGEVEAKEGPINESAGSEYLEKAPELSVAAVPQTPEQAQQAGMENPDLGKFLGKQEVSLQDIKEYITGGQVPQFVAAAVFMAVKERASDVHIEPFEKVVRLRYRIDGELGDIILLPISLNPSIVSRVKILAKMKLDEQRIPQDGRFEVNVGTEVIDVRVSTLPTVFGEKVVLRLLSKSKKLERLEDLGLDGLQFDRLIKAISQPYGIVLSTGPTGSGKTTTLYSVLYRLNKPEVNIVTLEDPVEYEIQGINQVQVKPQIGFGFANGLRSVLRQDPNIIMVGEIRDRETADLAVHAALTGHLVLSTLHTNNAASALPRLYNLKVEPFLLTSSVNAIIGQRLVRRVCPKCREEINVPQSVLFEVKKEFEKLNLNLPLKFFRGRGCPECKGGFHGRVGIFEVLTITEAIENLVLDKSDSDTIFNQAVKDGMITMRQDGFIKAVKGITTVDEVLRVTEQTKEG